METSETRDVRSPLLRHPIAVIAAGIFIFGLLHALAGVVHEILVGFFALLVAVVMSFPVNWMSRRIPRSLAVVITLLAIIGGLFAIGYFAAPVVTEQAENLGHTIPHAIQKVEEWMRGLRHSGAVTALTQNTGGGGGGTDAQQTLTSKLGQGVETLISKTIPAALGAVSFLAGCFVVLVLAAFLVSDPDGYRRALRTLVPRQHEAAFDETWSRMGKGLRQWMGGIVVAMITMGIVCGLGLWIAGIQGWFMLGLLTFLGTFVPYLGAIVSAIPGLLVGLSQSPTHFLYALIVYVVVHHVEGYLIEPLVMKRAVKLRPAELLGWQAVVAGVFGAIGFVVATPLLVCIKMAVGYLWTERKLGKEGAAPRDVERARDRAHGRAA